MCIILSIIVYGIIPAYAGNTHFIVIVAVTWRDHPRVCGEHETVQMSLGYDVGSSPRMRGTPPDSFFPHRTFGIIPAYAGNTAQWSPVRFDEGDHPRVCGEHTVISGCRLSFGGSSPRMRGTHVVVFPKLAQLGIIPAYAGNTSLSPASTSFLRDHPRVCGEHRAQSV